MYKKKPFTFICLAGTFFFLLLCAYAFSKGKEEAYAHIPTIFEEVIAQDCSNRLARISKAHYPLGRKAKHLKITTEKGSETIHFADSLDEQTANQLMFQYVMLNNNPLQPDTVNKLFKQTLEQHRISTQATGVIYQYQEKKQYSENDSIGMQSAFLTEAKFIDIKQSASVQAWAKCTFGTIVGHIPAWMKLVVLAYVALLVGVGIHYIRQKEKAKRNALQERHKAERRADEAQRKMAEEQRAKEETERIKAEKEKWEKAEAERIQREESLFGDSLTVGDMTLYERTRTVYASGVTRELKKNEFRLLRMFLTTPDHTFRSEYIEETFWPENDDASSNVHSLVRQLRMSLKDFPNYRLESVKEKTFKLIVGKKKTTSTLRMIRASKRQVGTDGKK